MADYRLRQIPPAAWRIVTRVAGDRLNEGLLRLITLWADGRVDPLSKGDPIATVSGARGGQARARNMSPEARADSARQAAVVRWAQARHHGGRHE